MTRSEYVIMLFGCDDVTVFRVALEPAEAALVRRLSRMSREVSSTDCQPRLHIASFDVTDIDKVVSIDEQACPIPTTLGDRARVRFAAGMVPGPPRRDRRLGGRGGVRVEPVGDPVPGMAGEDGTH